MAGDRARDLFHLRPEARRSPRRLRGRVTARGQSRAHAVARIRYHLSLYRILAAIIILIVYGSLYPWHFAFRHLPASPPAILYDTWDVALATTGLPDILINVAAYVPLGMVAYLCRARRKVTLFNVVWPVVLGFLVSSTMEMMQLYVPGRNTSALDVVLNTVGSGLGVFAGELFLWIFNRLNEKTGLPFPPDVTALAMLFGWTGYLLFPLFPVMRLGALRLKLVQFLQPPVFRPLTFLSAALCCLVVGYLVRSIGARPIWPWLLVSASAILGQVILFSRQPYAADVLGAVFGCLLFLGLDRWRAGTKVAAIGFFLLVVLRQTAPFHFLAEASPFSWVPFGALLATNWQVSARVLLEKLFYYGVAIWMMRLAGARLRTAMITVAVVLLALEVLQTHLPGRTPDITDPLLAVLLALAFDALAQHPGFGDGQNPSQT